MIQLKPSLSVTVNPCNFILSPIKLQGSKNYFHYVNTEALYFTLIFCSGGKSVSAQDVCPSFSSSSTSGCGFCSRVGVALVCESRGGRGGWGEGISSINSQNSFRSDNFCSFPAFFICSSIPTICKTNIQWNLSYLTLRGKVNYSFKINL